MSLRRPTGFPRACSGLMYAAVPKITPIWVMAGVVMVGDLDASAEVPAGSIAFANPKSKHLHRPVRSDLDVRRLQIAVDDPLLVRRFERLRDLARDGQRLIEWNSALRDPIGQRWSFDELQYQSADTRQLLRDRRCRRCWDDSATRGLPLRAESGPGARGRLRETMGGS